MATSGGAVDPEQQLALPSLLAAVEKYQGELDEDLEIREGIRSVVREIEKATKKASFTIFNIHSNPREENLKATGAKLKEILETLVHPLIVSLKEKLPTGEYYKYNDHFKHAFQRLSYMGIMSSYLQNGSICTIGETAAAIGLKSVEEKGDETLMLDYDDYLIGLLELAGELSRFCRNCVTFGGDIKRIYSIHESINQLNAGMHNITFKNDYLRRRYDGLKYNIKSVEEVIYDLKMRGITEDLKNPAAVPTNNLSSESESKTE